MSETSFQQTKSPLLHYILTNHSSETVDIYLTNNTQIKCLVRQYILKKSFEFSDLYLNLIHICI